MKKPLALWVIIALTTTSAWAHIIAYDLDKVNHGQVFFDYLIIGFEHIIPMGIDHILFVLCIFFLNTNLKSIVWQASMFTLAHSITLGLAMYGIIQPPANIIEPLIALSIVLLALENIFFTTVKPWRMALVFLFGLVHGMGFASALSDFGLPKNAFAIGLVAFNVGVELGQLSIILFMYFLVARTFSENTWYRKRIVIPVSLVIAFIAGFWTIERIMMI